MLEWSSMHLMDESEFSSVCYIREYIVPTVEFGGEGMMEYCFTEFRCSSLVPVTG